MATPSLPQEMLRYFLQLNDAEQKSVLQMLKTFISGRKGEVKPITIEEYNREIDEADAEIDGGEYIAHEDVIRRYLKK